MLITDVDRIPDYGAYVDWDALESKLSSLSSLLPRERIPYLERMAWNGDIPMAAYSALPICESQKTLRSQSPVAYTIHPSLDCIYDQPWEDHYYSAVDYLEVLPQVKLPEISKCERCAIPLEPRPLPDWMRERDSGFRAASVCLLDLAGKPILNGEMANIYRLLRFGVQALAPACAWQDFKRHWGGGPEQDWTLLFGVKSSNDSLEDDLLDFLAAGLGDM